MVDELSLEDKLKTEISVHDRTIENHSAIATEADAEISKARDALRDLVSKRSISIQNVRRAKISKAVAEDQLSKIVTQAAELTPELTPAAKGS